MSDDKTLIGCEEWFSLAALGIPAIKARVDSGAKTSALHAFNIQPYQKGSETWVKFSVHPLQNVRNLVVECDALVVDRRSIKSSSGTAEKRYVIRTPITIQQHTLEIELTLTNRDSMGYRMLLGREAMQGRMIVDPAEHFLLGNTTQDALNQLYGEIAQPAGGLKIGVLGSDINNHSHQRILEAGRERGHEMVFLDLQDCYVKLVGAGSEIEFTVKHRVNDFDAIIPYLPSNTASYGSAIVQHFESLGVFCLNGSESIRRAHDKLLSLTILQTHDLPIPATAFAKAGTPSAELAAAIGDFPLVIKFIEGTIDRERRVINDQASLDQFRRTQPSNSANLLAQSYFGAADELLFHVLVVDGKSVTAKQAHNPLTYENNTNRKPALTTKASREERQTAAKAARALRLKVAQVSLVRTSQGPIVLSVNPAPRLENLEKGKNPKNVAARFIKQVEKALGWRELGVE